MNRLLLAVLLLSAPQALRACTCLTPDPKTSFQSADAVFLGEVLEYENNRARMRPLERFKGADGEVVEFTTADSGTTCGYGGALARGSRHLIYARDGEEVSLCSRSRPEELAACDLKYLRSRAAWWRSPLSSLRLLRWLGRHSDPCMRNSG